MAISLGLQVNDLLGNLGIQGGLIGAQIDLLAGNKVGTLKNLKDAFSEAALGHATNGAARRALGGMGRIPGFGLTLAPGIAARRLPRAATRNYYRRMDLGRGASHRAWFGHYLNPKRRSAAKLERLLKKNPAVRAAFERSVGGKFIPDGRNDGRITIRRSVKIIPRFPGLSPLHNSVAGLVRNAQAGITRLAKQLQLLQNGGADKSSASKSTSQSSSSSSKLQGATSFEDLLFIIMMNQMKKLQAEIGKKGDELKALQNKKKGKGGLLGGLGSLGGLAGSLIGGPVGGMLGQSLGGLVGGALGGGGAKKSEEEVTKQLEQLTKKYERFLTSIDNIMSTLHKTSMSSIRKIGQ